MFKMKIYTDGSCIENPGPGGWVSILVVGNHAKAVCGGKSYTTNNIMEVTAVLRGLQRALDYAEKVDEIEVYSDSMYVIRSITNKWLDKWVSNGWVTRNGGPVKNIDLWKEMWNILQTCKEWSVRVTFHWVKGHAGNPYNEECDRIAKEQARKMTIESQEEMDL